MSYFQFKSWADNVIPFTRRTEQAVRFILVGQWGPSEVDDNREGYSEHKNYTTRRYTD